MLLLQSGQAKRVTTQREESSVHSNSQHPTVKKRSRGMREDFEDNLLTGFNQE